MSYFEHNAIAFRKLYWTVYI